MKNICIAIFSTVLFASCDKTPSGPGEVDTYVPIYGSMAEARNISQVGPQPIVNGGKIATFGRYVFQVESEKGIHIIDYTNAAAPVKLSFLKIPLCREVTLKDNFLYTNNISDLVALNISNISNIQVSARIQNAFPAFNQQYPDATGIYFQCVDPGKFVTGWEIKKTLNPKCRR